MASSLLDNNAALNPVAFTPSKLPASNTFAFGFLPICLNLSASFLPNATIKLVSGLFLTTSYVSLTGFSDATLTSTEPSSNVLYNSHTAILSSAVIPSRVLGDTNTTT